MMSDKIAYTDGMLSAIFHRKESTIKLALTTFEQFGMIEIFDNVIIITNWEKHQNVDRLAELREYNRKAQQKHREEQYRRQRECYRRKVMNGWNESTEEVG